MKTKYTVDYFIKKFRAIPEEKWITHDFNGPHDSHCSLGFCGFGHDKETPEGNELLNLFDNQYLDLVDLNDGNLGNVIFGDTPKERILTALENIKHLQ